MGQIEKGNRHEARFMEFEAQKKEEQERKGCEVKALCVG